MKPLSPRAQHALRAYRSENSIPPALRARLLARAAEQAAAARTEDAPVARSPQVPRPSRLRLVAWAGSASVLLIGLGLFPRLGAETAIEKQAPLAAPAPTAPSERSALPALAPIAPVLDAPAIAPSRLRAKRSLESKAKSAAVSTSAQATNQPEQPAQTLATPIEAPRVERAPDPPYQGSASKAEAAEPSGSSVWRVPTRRAEDEAPQPAPALDEEVMLMRRAYDFLRAGEAGRALSALGEHARLFPQGKLTVMRRVARIQALCDLERRDEASQESARFLREHADSPYAARVQKVCVPRKVGGP